MRKIYQFLGGIFLWLVGFLAQDFSFVSLFPKFVLLCSGIIQLFPLYYYVSEKVNVFKMFSICPFLCPLEAMSPAVHAVCILLQRLFSAPWCLKRSFGFSSEWSPYSINQNVIAITRQCFEVKLLECELSWSTSMHKRLDSQIVLPSGECLFRGAFLVVEKVLCLVQITPKQFWCIERMVLLTEDRLFFFYLLLCYK